MLEIDIEVFILAQHLNFIHLIISSILSKSYSAFHIFRKYQTRIVEREREDRKVVT